MNAIIMFCGPHYGGQVHYGRIDHAIRLALRLNSPLVVCGDGNRGQDVNEFVERARDRGVQAYRAYDPEGNTRADARAAASALSRPDLGNVTDIRLVTDWYHMLRAFIALRLELARALPDREISAAPAPVWQHFMNVLSLLPNEIRGAFDYINGRPQLTRGETFFKPAHSLSHSNSPRPPLSRALS